MGTELQVKKEQAAEAFFRDQGFAPIPATQEEVLNLKGSRKDNAAGAFFRSMGLPAIAAPEPKTRPPAEKFDVEEAFTGRLRMTPEMEKLPRFSELSLGEMQDALTPAGEKRVGKAQAAKQMAKITFMMGTTPRDDERAQIMSKWEGFGSRTDDRGNTIIVYPSGKETKLNKPGISTGDILTGTAEAMKGATIAQTGGLVAGPATKMGVVAGAELGAGFAQEGLQAAQGGEINPEDPFFTAVLGGLSEGAPLVKKAWRSLSASGRKLLAQENMMNSAVLSGLSRQDLNAVKKVLRENDIAFDEQGLARLPSVTSMTREGNFGKGFDRPFSEMSAASQTKASFADTIRTEYGVLSGSAKESIERGIKAFSPEGTDPIKSLENARDAMKGLLKNMSFERKAKAQVKYDKALDSVDLVNVRAAVDNISVIRKSSAPEGSAIRAKLDNVQKQLTDDFITDEISPRKLQNVIRELRDLKRIVNDKSVTSAVQTQAGVLERQLTDILDKATGGLYNEADAVYRSMSDAYNKVVKSSAGKAAELEGEEIAGLVGMLFNPGTQAREFSKRFFKTLRKEDPQAAKDLISMHIHESLKPLGDTPTATQMLDKLFGDASGTSNMLLELSHEAAPDSGLARRLFAVKRYMEFAQKLEFVDPASVSKRLAKENISEGGLLYRIGEAGTAPTAMKTESKKMRTKKNALAWMEIATNDTWSKEFDEILKLPTTSKERMSQATTLFRRFMENLGERGPDELLDKGVIKATAEGSRRSQPEDK